MVPNPLPGYLLSLKYKRHGGVERSRTRAQAFLNFLEKTCNF